MFDRLKRLIDEINDKASNAEVTSEFDEGYLLANKEISKKLKMLLLDVVDDMK